MLSREKTKTDDPRQEVNDYPVKEKYVLSRLLPEYVSLYRIDLNSGKYEILRLDENTNARKLAETDPHPAEIFDEYTRRYADNFILDEEKEEFIDWHLCANMKRRLLHEEKLTYHYHSVSKEGKDSYYEAYVVKGKTDDETFDAFLGYRNIDSILYKEKEIQEKLQKALNEARLGNEIISSIARTYQYISRIDIQADYFEEISNRDVEHLKYIHSGTLSENNKRVCRGLVAEEYQDAFEKFTDISTLPERMKDEESVVMEYRMKDGSWHSLRFIEKKRDETGRLTHVLCAIRSISDAKRREQTLIYQVAEAKKDAAVKTRFLSNMSHEIRTPLNAIVGFSNLIAETEDPDERREYVAIVQENNELLLKLISDILDLSKIEAGTLEFNDVEFDVNQMCQEIVRSLSLKVLDKPVELRFGDHLPECRLVGDKTRITQVLINFINNALKFTREGSVTLGYRCDDGMMLTFYVEDTGTGIPEQEQESVFERFVKLNSFVQGTGLGLAISKSIVEQMGGRIGLNSEPGKGSCFWFTHPYIRTRSVSAVASDAEMRQPGVSEGKMPVVLVAEDTDSNFLLVSLILKKGYEVLRAHNGAEAVRMCREFAPDVVLMDMKMPVMDGLEATRQIREAGSSVPIIAVTAYAYDSDRAKALDVGCDDYIAKPLTGDVLKKKLRKHLKR